MRLSPLPTPPPPERPGGPGVLRMPPVRPHGAAALRMPPPVTWPIAALLVGYPLWWALGFGGLSIVVVALPMAYVLWRRRPIVIPKGMGLWMLLLAGYLVSALMLGDTPPGTYGELGTGRVLGYVMRLALYVALLVMVLYLGNLTERELPQRTLVRMLGVLFVTTVAGGLLGVIAPRFEFTSPLEMLLPEWISGNSFVRNLIHPTAAQVQHVLGHASPRPEAPFEWANAWGSNVSVLLIWFVVGWWTYGGRVRRVLCVVVAGLATIPIVYSLNRGLWIGLAVAVAYVLMRARPRTGLVIGAALAAAALVFVAGPLNTIVAQRLESPHSNAIRAFTVASTLEAATHSPVIGYGNTRNAFGNYQTITTGRTGWCAECGHPPLGSDGQIWLLLITQGFTGAALYVAFFTGAIRRFWRDRTPIGQAGTLVMILVLLYMFVYDGLVTALSLYLISFALLWRNGQSGGVPAVEGRP
ncbi:O-antigen ligase family protein [Sphaerisporangium sp. NPDC088356]|uniref:O-antigen ligase family protein n=1 Tax=Sphaerisporangium sp. NPDC088356 TaxID=3154871 RepID=UPI00342451CE